MRVAIASVQVPFIRGGAELLASGLADALRKNGHDAEIVTMPFRFAPAREVLRSMDSWEREDCTTLDCGEVDVVVALKFPSYYLSHPRKVVWLLHQHRAVYELFDTPFGLAANPDNAALRGAVHERDTRHLAQASALFSLSKRVSERLHACNGLVATPLYHPPPDADRFHCGESMLYIYFPSRLEALKRQELLIRAMRHVRSPVVAILSGVGGIARHLHAVIHELDLQSRVRLVGHVARSEMLSWYANALGVFFGPHDEDYGYVTLEAQLSKRPVITCSDSGGPLEFVNDGVNGFVVEPDPQAIAEKLDELHENRAKARALGEAGYDAYRSKEIGWDAVVARLLA